MPSVAVIPERLPSTNDDPLPVSVAPLAASDAEPWLQALPAWRADGHVIAFAQSLVVFGGLATISVVLACWRAFPEARNMPPLGKA